MKTMHIHAKLRIKMLVIKMQRKFHLHNIKDNAPTSPSDRDKKSLGNNRRCLFKGKKNEPRGDSEEGKKCQLTEEFGNNLVYENEEVLAATTLSKLLTLEKSLEPDGTASSEGKQNKKYKKPVKMSLPLLSFLDKKNKGWRNFKVSIRFSKVRRKVSSWHLVWIPSKLLGIRLKLKMVRSVMKRKVTKQSKKKGDKYGNKERGEEELCKKRILMGVKCKPLSSSGILRYDEDGIFLPEIPSFTSTPCHLP
ncbi:hypothetical protein Lalb_Chr02g0148001 [Lupinus albus]|uniref:Uncharacterized protein n=1 Tax=Lupinus albus TaxID=3870 RepID=A0A6A4QZN0_LUPAL|nr:hypothetical protein Lalb_Chr02g0148001 [Lupinus albus]